MDVPIVRIGHVWRYLDSGAVCDDGHGAVQIGAENLGPPGCVAIEDLVVGKFEAILEPGGYHCNPRRYAGDEARRAGGLAAVMRDQQHVACEVPAP